MTMAKNHTPPQPPAASDAPAERGENSFEAQVERAGLQSAATGDQPSLLGEGGMEEKTPIERIREEVDLVVQTLRRAFVTDVGTSAHFDRLAGKLRELRSK